MGSGVVLICIGSRYVIYYHPVYPNTKQRNPFKLRIEMADWNREKKQPLGQIRVDNPMSKRDVRACMLGHS
jgi:hypothetical protein